MNGSVKRLKVACYTTNITMAVIAFLSPLLFVTLRAEYGISYSLLGLLVLVNFCTQLGVDLLFSFFSHKFNIDKAVKGTPILAAIGLVLYALSPQIFGQNVYVGLLLATVVFSSAAGLGEVLISPVIAALPSENPDREMSRLHSSYAWGSVGVVLFGTVFLLIFGRGHWQWMTLLFALGPVAAALLYLGCEIPDLQQETQSGARELLHQSGVWLCVAGIFCGGAAEVTMAQWSSGYLEQALGIEKVWGDVFGVAFFSVMLGLGRTLYAKHGRSIEKILLWGAVGAAICYLVAVVSSRAIIGLAACALTGLCTSMLWPGSLVVATDRFPKGGVIIFAMMAAGGDLGASVGSQLVGVVTDLVLASGGSEQLGLKLGLAGGMLFPLVAVPIFAILLKNRKEQ